MRVRIHRGARQIGGNCVEIEHDGSRLILDLGLPLDADEANAVALPDIPGIGLPDDGRLAGLIISHSHADHWGLLGRVKGPVPLAMGKEAHAIVRASAPFQKNSQPIPDLFHPLHHQRRMQLGAFGVTPYLVDHSAYDSYALLIEAGGRSVFYSGDFRAHGRKGTLFPRLTAQPIAPVDALLLEGTTLGREDKPMPAETDLEAVALDFMRATKGVVLAAFSAQNIDRYVTFFRAALRSGRSFVIDPYLAEVIRTIGNPKIPGVGSDRICVHTPKRMAAKLRRNGHHELRERYRGIDISLAAIAQAPGKFVMLFRDSMIGEVAACANFLKGAGVIYSMWPGYLDRSRHRLDRWSEANGLGFAIIHTSGHADIESLESLVAALRPGKLVPIHTERPELYARLSPSVCMLPDGEWLDLAAD